jgi:hypothetical protein
MSETPRIRTHSELCWQWHPECHIERLKESLEVAKEALREAMDDTKCRCEEIWTCRSLHAPECMIDTHEFIREALAKIEEE